MTKSYDQARASSFLFCPYCYEEALEESLPEDFDGGVTTILHCHYCDNDFEVDGVAILGYATYQIGEER